MRFKTLILAVAFLCMAFGTTALAGTLGWQTTPILGTDYQYTGDVVMNTGPIPFTIPHDSDPSDPEYNGSASPSMTLFTVGQSIATGSGVWVAPDVVYDIYGVFQQLTIGGRTTTYHEVFHSDDWFIMEVFSSVGDLAMGTESGDPMIGLSSADIGNWTYTETWTNQADLQDTITAINGFTVGEAVPEPGTALLLGAALLGLAARRYSRKLS